MKQKNKMELTEGSKYRITSLGGRDRLIESKGVFKGFVSIGIDENGLLLELDKSHGELKGKNRIIPVHVILAIDVIEAKENKEEEDADISHYVG